MTCGPNIGLSQAEQDRFGVRTVRVLLNERLAISACLAGARRLNAELLIVRMPVSAWAAVRELEREGAVLADVLCQYRWQCDRHSPAPAGERSPAQLSVRTAGAADAELAGKLASRIFADYRGHYHRNNRLLKARADEIYPHWAQQCCLGATPKHPVFLLERDQEPIGVCALRAGPGDASDVALFGVVPGESCHGLGTHLLEHAQRHAMASGASSLLYSTQVDNMRAARMVQRCGFVSHDAFFTYHLWLDQEHAHPPVIST